MHFIIRYTVKPDLVDEQEAAVREFIAGIRAVDDSGVSYTSFKDGDGVSFTHIGAFADEATLKRFQSQPHFEKFSSEIKARCVDGPTAGPVTLVASSDK